MMQASVNKALAAVAVVMACGLGASARAGTINWEVSFDIVGDDHVELTFQTSDELVYSTTPGSFSGYLINAESMAGTSGNHAVKGLPIGSFGFGGATPPGTLTNDNLFYGNTGVPYSNSHPVVSYAGLAYEELDPVTKVPTGKQYQLFTDSTGALKGCTGGCGLLDTPDVPPFVFTVTNLKTSIPCVPEPEGYALASVGLGMMGLAWRRRESKKSA